MLADHMKLQDRKWAENSKALYRSDLLIVGLVTLTTMDDLSFSLWYCRESSLSLLGWKLEVGSFSSKSQCSKAPIAKKRQIVRAGASSSRGTRAVRARHALHNQVLADRQIDGVWAAGLCSQIVLT